MWHRAACLRDLDKQKFSEMTSLVCHTALQVDNSHDEYFLKWLCHQDHLSRHWLLSLYPKSNLTNPDPTVATNTECYCTLLDGSQCFQIHIHFVLLTIAQDNIIATTITVLQIWKLRRGEIKYINEGHTSKFLASGLNQVTLTTECRLQTIHYYHTQT